MVDKKSSKKSKSEGKKKGKSILASFKSGKSRPLLHKVSIWIFKIALFFLFLLTLLFGLVYIGTFGQLPDAKMLLKIKEPVASEVYSVDGKLLGRYYVENRSNVSFKEISPNVIKALIATEDARFYEHRGVDEWAVARVFLKTIFLANRNSGGGSTLSQQIVKNIFGRENYGPLTLPVVKIRESIIAYRLEKLYSKEEILTLYLNTVPFGENTFGIETAAERFFSTTPKKLTVLEAATLVGILKANNSYNPRLNPEKSLQRRNTVIRLMQKNKYLTKDEADKYCEQPILLKYNYLVYNTGSAAYFREMIRPSLEKWCADHKKADGSPYNLYTDGLRIVTTIDSRMQRYAEAAQRTQMTALQNSFEEQWNEKTTLGGDKNILLRAMKRSERYQKLKRANKTQKEIDKDFKTAVNTKLFSWAGDKTVKITPLDSIKYSMKLLHSAFIAISPKYGAVKVWIGGNNFRYFQYDNVRSARQVGSTIKPIIYASAIENGMSADKYFANQKITYPDYQDWSPGNADEKYGGFYSLEGALCKSVNTVSVQVLMESGISKAVDLAHKMGIESDLPQYPSLALGSAAIPLVQLAKAYCCFANDGKTVDPYYLIKIEDGNGKLLEKFDYENESVVALSSETTKIMNRFLQSVVNEGTATAIRKKFGIQGDFAGKTGTTQDFADGWFMGYTPDLVTASWVGAEDPAIHFKSIAYGSGSYMALPITGGFFQRLNSDPAFSTNQLHTFAKPDEAIVEKLEIPRFVEQIEQSNSGSFWDIFRGKANNEAKPNSEAAEKKKQSKDNDKKPSLWKRIKEALRTSE